MSIAVQSSHDEKEKWLLRPIDWAFRITGHASIFGGFFWYHGDLPASDLAVLLVASCFASSILLCWGLRRIMNVTRGRF